MMILNEGVDYLSMSAGAWMQMGFVFAGACRLGNSCAVELQRKARRRADASRLPEQVTFQAQP